MFKEKSPPRCTLKNGESRFGVNKGNPKALDYKKFSDPGPTSYDIAASHKFAH